jgi:calcineurin-like phosphoesterase family protein
MMDEYMIQNWNNVVGKNDKVYHLGDLTFSNKKLNEIMPRLNGTKVLIKGNHDNLKPNQYLQYFKDIRAYHILDKFLLSHIPVHIDSRERWKANIHGHLHNNIIDDPNYINVSVERINYTPIDFEEIRSRFK